MQTIKKWIAASLSVLTVAMIWPLQTDAAKPDPKIPVSLKMNDYYVAYTYPKSPYVDNKNRLIVPLRAVSDLLGASVSYDSKTKTATIVQEETKVEIQQGNKEAKVNGNAVVMDTVAISEKGFMLVPARVLFDAFSFKVSQVNHVITLKDDRLLRSGRLQYLAEDDAAGVRRLIDADALQPMTIAFSTFVKNNVTGIDFSVTAKNISGQDIAQGHADVHAIFYFQNGRQAIDSEEASSPDIPNTDDSKRPFVKKDEVLTQTYKSDGGVVGQPNPLQYILIAGRTIKQQGE